MRASRTWGWFLSSALMLPGCFLDRSGVVVGDGEDSGAPGVDAGPMRDDAGPIRRDSGPNCVETGDEICDDKDNDCDGIVDESLVVTSCDSDDGDLCFDDFTGCTNGTPTCVDDGSSTDEREICDTADNDCDGADDDGEDDPRLGESCDGEGDEDFCTEGTYVGCSGGQMVCDDETESTADDQCNGQDDDCNRVIDDMGGNCGCTRRNRGDGHSYIFCTDDDDWHEARAFCEEQGYRLARIESEEENEWIRDQLGNGDGHWIGATDDPAYSPAEGTFVWYDDAEPRAAVPYDNWTTGEPSNSGESEHCAEIDRDDTGISGTPGGWNDDDCGQTGGQAYVCEAGF